MRGIFSNPKKNFFNFLTFGKNPKVQPSMVLRRIFLSKGFSSVFNGWIRIFFNDRLIIGGDDSRSNWVSREVFRRETETIIQVLHLKQKNDDYSKMSLFHILSNTILNLTVVEIPLEKDSKKWKNQNFNKNYVTLRW